MLTKQVETLRRPQLLATMTTGIVTREGLLTTRETVEETTEDHIIVTMTGHVEGSEEETVDQTTDVMPEAPAHTGGLQGEGHHTLQGVGLLLLVVLFRHVVLPFPQGRLYAQLLDHPTGL